MGDDGAGVWDVKVGDKVVVKVVGNVKGGIGVVLR